MPRRSLSGFSVRSRGRRAHAQQSIGSRLRRAWRALTGTTAALYAGSAGVAFKGAEGGRLLGDWRVSMADIDKEIRSSIHRLRARTRDLERNNPYVGQMLNLYAVNVIGATGPALQQQVRFKNGKLDDKTNDAIEDAFRRWAMAPVTIDRRANLTEVAQKAIRAVVRDGEVFVRIWRGFEGNRYRLALELIEPDYVPETINLERSARQPLVKSGVQMDDFGAPTAYYVRTARASRREGHGAEAIPADQILHLYRPDRANQVRGYPWIASIVIPCWVLDRYDEAELYAARAGASKMGIVTNPEGEGAPLTDRDDLAETEDESGLDFEMEASPGTIDILPAGYGFESWNPDHPSGTYGPFTKTVLRKIATGGHVSYNVLASDLEGVSYSSMRSGLLSERDHWRVVQALFGAKFYDPIHEAFLQTALLSRALSLPSMSATDYLDHLWNFRGWPWVDPEKETRATILGVANGLTSRTATLRAQGIDFDSTLEDLARETEAAKEKGVPIDGGEKAAAAPPPPLEPEDDAGDAADDGTTSISNGNRGGRVFRDPARR